MPLPTIYDEPGLRAYVVATLSNVGTALGWSAASAEVGEAVYDAIYAYGPTDTTVNPPTYTIALMTDMQKLRAFARREGWHRAVDALAAMTDMRTGSLDEKSSQLYAQAERRYNAAYSEALAYDSSADMILPATITQATRPYAPENTASEFG